jgi:hypothetical protein
MNLPDKLRFDRHELAGAFGDIGTDLPLIAGILLATKLDATGVFLAFGLAQIASGLRYGLPMPVQPLKAMAVVVIAGQAGGGLLQLAGLMSGVLMLLLSVSGLLDRLQGLIPVVVVRGVQAGLGLALARTAFGLAGRESPWGWIAAALAVGLLLWLRGHRRVPGSLVVVGVGVLWAAIYRIDWPALVHGFGWVAPRPAVLPWDQWLAALMVLVLPQLPLSLSNSVFATQRTVADLFPERPVTLRGLGRTYSLMNLLSPWIGGIPMCHGCSGAFQEVLRAFPAPMLGAILLVEAGVLLLLLRDLVRTPGELGLAAVVALICVFAPQGYFTGMIVGSGLFYASRRRRPASAATPAGAPG